MKRIQKPEDYMKEPYSRVVIPDLETGTFTALISEFPGCIAQGASLEEAYTKLEAVAVSWIQAALDLGQTIPSPASEATYSGKVLLRLPKSLHKQTTQMAEIDGCSLNQYIVAAIAQKVGQTVATREISKSIESRLVTSAANIFNAFIGGNKFIISEIESIAGTTKYVKIGDNPDRPMVLIH
jgi:predicted RNase H-like HicB family nuclease